MVFLVGILSVQEDVTAMRTVIVKNQTSLLVMEGRMVRMQNREAMVLLSVEQS